MSLKISDYKGDWIIDKTVSKHERGEANLDFVQSSLQDLIQNVTKHSLTIPKDSLNLQKQ